ncbi:hypothetical protein BB560_004482, partial [Smittium megazygosporum]
MPDENLRFRIIRDDSESQTAISGLGRRVGQLDTGQTENAEYQGTEPDQSPHPTATRLVMPSSSSKGSLHRQLLLGMTNRVAVGSLKKAVALVLS